MWVPALLDRGLAPRRFGRRCFGLHVFCECFVIAHAIESPILTYLTYPILTYPILNYPILP